jgi:hypothetical protein
MKKLAVSVDYTLQAVHLDPSASEVAAFAVKWWEAGTGEADNPHPVTTTLSVVSPLPSGVTAALSPTSIFMGAAGGEAQCGIKFSASKTAPPTNGATPVTVEMKSSAFTGFLIFYLTVWQ